MSTTCCLPVLNNSKYSLELKVHYLLCKLAIDDEKLIEELERRQIQTTYDVYGFFGIPLEEEPLEEPSQMQMQQTQMPQMQMQQAQVDDQPQVDEQAQVDQQAQVDEQVDDQSQDQVDDQTQVDEEPLPDVYVIRRKK
jgi:uncharacterized protein YbcC (UPF0753/DUF2309 family)